MRKFSAIFYLVIQYLVVLYCTWPEVLLGNFQCIDLMPQINFSDVTVKQQRKKRGN